MKLQKELGKNAPDPILLINQKQGRAFPRAQRVLRWDSCNFSGKRDLLAQPEPVGAAWEEFRAFFLHPAGVFTASRGAGLGRRGVQQLGWPQAVCGEHSQGGLGEGEHGREGLPAAGAAAHRAVPRRNVTSSPDRSPCRTRSQLSFQPGCAWGEGRAGSGTGTAPGVPSGVRAAQGWERCSWAKPADTGSEGVSSSVREEWGDFSVD